MRLMLFVSWPVWLFALVVIAFLAMLGKGEK